MVWVVKTSSSDDHELMVDYYSGPVWWTLIKLGADKVRIVSAVGTTVRKTPCRRLRVGGSAGICWVYGNNWEEIWIETQNKPNFLEHLPSLLLNFNAYRSRGFCIGIQRQTYISRRMPVKALHREGEHISVGTEEFPAARVESSTALIEEISRDQDGSIQVGTEEFPAARVESSTALIEEISRDQDGSIQDGVPNVPDPLYDSNESIVEESDDEVVPKLRRTKSILMERLPLSDALFDSSDDTTEDLSTSKSDRASERQRRYCYPSLVGTDNTSGESEEEYVPNPNEESTDSDGSSELSVKGKDEKKTAPHSQSARKSLTKTSFVSRSQGKRVLKTSFENRSQESVDMDSFLQEGMEDADLPKEQEKECDLTSPQEDTDIPETHGSEDEVDVRSLQECSSTANELTLKRSVKKRGKKAVIKRSWTPEESAAVNKHLRKFIVMNQVPGKEDCERCIAAEPDALRTRDWKAVKYFIKNRITAVRRKLE
ncbi:hypothetical protein DNTS_017026 [Danionella cerebrum]|uniref:Uncharacterized protein n=1 Tax=Danionella cerebrum TaxID=2873325 RepID=A0A553MKN9_9TELE|nr:hypothetical protein DNTS_017026 [Danionella translucida]